MNPADRFLLLRRKLAFLRTPVARRVRLELETDGRQITYLLVSLHAQGYSVHVIGSPIVYRDLLALRHFTRIPFIIGGPPRPCGLAICDTEAALARRQEPSKVLLNYDFFNGAQTAPRMPYFMHPVVYAKGLHRLPVPDPAQQRPVRLAFFGTRDADFYTRNFHFPLLDREQILATFLDAFSDRIWRVDSPVGSWGKHEIAVAIDGKGGDNDHKAFLPLADYLQSLRKCDFFLSPPGWCMPLSHNLIEGMAAGCIPIVNCADFMHPALKNHINCLVFHNNQSLIDAVKAALDMPHEQIRQMRWKVSEYYARHLMPEVGLAGVLSGDVVMTTCVVNAEELSISLPSLETMADTV